MGATIRRMRAELATSRLQRLSIFLILLFATAALTASLTVRAESETGWDNLFEQSNGAHAWVYSDEATLERLRARPEVVESAGPFVMGRAQVPGAGPFGRPAELWLQGVPGGAWEMGEPIVVAGRWLRGEDEVVLPRAMAARLGLEPGEVLTVTSSSAGTVELRVVGHALSAGHSPFITPQVAWTTPATLERVAPTGQFAALGIQLEQRGQARGFLDAFALDLPRGQFFMPLSWDDVRARNDEATTVIVLFLGIFSIFALGACALVIVNAISGRVVARYRDIGLLKAIGFTPAQLTGGFLLEQCGLALLAAIPGVVLGNLVVPFLDDPNRDLYTTSPTGHVDPLLSLVVGLGVVVLVGAATFVPAWRAGRISAVRAIQVGSGEVSSRPSRVAAAASALRLPVWVVVGLKNAFDRPLRSWFTVAALTVSVVTLTFVVTTEWTIRELLSRPELLGEPFEIHAETENVEALEAAIQADPEVDAYFERTVMNVPARGDHDATLAVHGPGFEKLDWVISSGRLFESPGEAIAGQGFLDVMDAGIGDTVELKVLDRTLRVTIVGRYRATEDGGRWLMIGTGTAQEQLGPAFRSAGFAVALRDGADADAAAARYRTAMGAGSIEVFDHSADGVNAIRGVATGLTVLLLVVGLTSLVGTMFNSIRERRRELGVLKAVGFTPGQVVGEVLAGAAWLTAIAVAVGLPLGLWVNSRISTQIGDTLGWGGGVLETPPLLWLAAVAPLILGAVGLAALVPAVAAVRQHANDALRFE